MSDVSEKRPWNVRQSSRTRIVILILKKDSKPLRLISSCRGESSVWSSVSGKGDNSVAEKDAMNAKALRRSFREEKTYMARFNREFSTRIGSELSLGPQIFTAWF